jgi:hypothetical protein
MNFSFSGYNKLTRHSVGLIMFLKNVQHNNFNQKVSEDLKYITRSILLSTSRSDIELSQIKIQETGLENCCLVCSTVYSDR